MPPLLPLPLLLPLYPVSALMRSASPLMFRHSGDRGVPPLSLSGLSSSQRDGADIPAALHPRLSALLSWRRPGCRTRQRGDGCQSDISSL